MTSDPTPAAPSTPTVSIRDATEQDLGIILDLRNARIPIDSTTWTTQLESPDRCRAWFAHKREVGNPVLVAEAGGEVVGYATYGEFRDNARLEGYRFTAELTIHVAADRHGSGIGRRLMDALIDRARVDGLHTLVAAVDGDNVGSIRFHERLGFVETARMPQIGFKFGRWLDLVLLQRVVDP